MKVAFLVFSPSGNGSMVARRLGSLLAARGIESHTVDLTGDGSWFHDPPSSDWLESHVAGHDLLCLAAPVYAHHLQFHMKDLIAVLPPPGGKWGALALPILSYGGFSTGVALKEAARLLERSGREVIGAARVAAPHAISRLPRNSGQGELRSAGNGRRVALRGNCGCRRRRARGEASCHGNGPETASLSPARIAAEGRPRIPREALPASRLSSPFARCLAMHRLRFLRQGLPRMPPRDRRRQSDLPRRSSRVYPLRQLHPLLPERCALLRHGPCGLERYFREVEQRLGTHGERRDSGFRFLRGRGADLRLTLCDESGSP